jgi:hypothetical protein
MNYPNGASVRRLLFACICIVHIFVPRAAEAQVREDGDTLQSIETPPAARPIEGTPFVFSPFDTIANEQVLQRHTYSLDHLLETVPGFVVNRSGPIGADVLFSRYGMGAGRGTVYMAGIPINDPQNDLVPFALFPTTTINHLVFNHSSQDHILGRAGLEGSVDVLELQPNSDKPFTAFELSKGTKNLRQRRVRFSSPRSTIGIDVGYDELLNDGYSYDPETGAVDFGRSVSRFQTMNLRGEFPNGESYFFSFRLFKDVFNGQLADPNDERRRNGHYAIASTQLNSWQLTLFEKDYDVSLPDSNTINHTTALYTRVTPVTSRRFDAEFGIGIEDIHSDQIVGGIENKRRTRLGTVGGHATVHGWRDVQARFEGALGHHYRGKTGWGGRAILSIPLLSSQEISINAGRSFRLPNLGERFLPLHLSQASGADKIVGNRYLDPELAWEAGVRIKSRIGFLHSEMRFTEIRVEDAITFMPVAQQDEVWLIPANGDGQNLRFLEGLWNAGRSFYGIRLGLAGGVIHAVGDREGFFANVPQTRVDASFSLSRDLFKSTSGISFLTEYQYTSTRRAFPGGDSPAHSILNLKLVARLLDAHLYLQWLNVLDENYRTIGPLMMTPRTLVYGVQWTIFN